MKTYRRTELDRTGLTRIAGCGVGRTAAAMAVITACLAAVGGSTDVNARRTIGAERELPTLAGADATHAINAERATRLDRGDWEPVDFRLPVDGTVHNALLKSEPSFGDEQPRAHGLYPTAESALDLGSDRGADAWRGVVEPFRAVVDLAIMPVRAFTDPAWGKRQSASNFKRWRSGAWYAGPVPEADGGADEDGGS